MEKYTPDLDDLEKVDRAGTHFPPHGDQTLRYQDIRMRFRQLATALLFECPHSRELSLALTNLEQAQFWANASIARNEPG